MGIEIIGVRRLYDALGCGLVTEKEICASGPIDGGKNVSVYIGPKPPLGVLTLEAEQYLIPGKESKLFHANHEYKSDCYLEIVITMEYEASEKISDGILAKDKHAREELLDVIKNKSELFEKLIDSISGIMGLKFHRQLVLKPLIENPIILSGPEHVSNFTGPGLEVLGQIDINENAQIILDGYVEALESVNEDVLSKAGSIFHWLTKAWREHDLVAKFIYLFIPLEGILQSDTEIPNEAHSNIENLINLVQKSDSSDKEKLLSFLEDTKKKYGPNLNTRFEEFAKKSAIPGWETDVKVFKKYNRMRNLLVHAGRKDIRTHINIEEETRTLEDLVERYLSVALLGNHDVYLSQWRPLRS
jgi:hypothetical protein